VRQARIFSGRLHFGPAFDTLPAEDRPWRTSTAAGLAVGSCEKLCQSRATLRCQGRSWVEQHRNLKNSAQFLTGDMRTFARAFRGNPDLIPYFPKAGNGDRRVPV
jgi:hypothetical protein